MEIKYQIFKEHQLLVHKYTGKFSSSDYIKCVLKVMQLPEWKYVTKVFNDLRDIDFFLAVTKINELTQFREGIIKKELLTVLLVDKPETTASAYLYMERLKSKYRVWYCSTFEFAIETLSLNMNETELKNILDNLKYTV